MESIIIGVIEMTLKILAERLEGLEIKKKEFKPFQNSITKIGEKIEENSGVLRRLLSHDS